MAHKIPCYAWNLMGSDRSLGVFQTPHRESVGLEAEAVKHAYASEVHIPAERIGLSTGSSSPPVTEFATVEIDCAVTVATRQGSNAETIGSRFWLPHGFGLQIDQLIYTSNGFQGIPFSDSRQMPTNGTNSHGCVIIV